MSGGMTPDGFDFSGFTAYVSNAAGTEIPRTRFGRDYKEKIVHRSDLRIGVHYSLMNA